MIARNMSDIWQRQNQKKKVSGEKLKPKFGPNEPKLAPKLCFLPFSQAWFISFKMHIMMAWKD